MLPRDDDGGQIGRHTPQKGVVLSADMPLILFCTVCADDRGTWVAQATVMEALHHVWQQEDNAWLVGDYVLMPDHAHFFCCPRCMSVGITVERWTAFWKDRFSKRVGQLGWRWQRGVFHTRMRTDAHHAEKRDYMRDNPVTAGLVTCADDWPWRGRVHDLDGFIRSFGEPKP